MLYSRLFKRKQMDTKEQIIELISEIEKIQDMWLDKNNVLKALRNILKKKKNKYK